MTDTRVAAVGRETVTAGCGTEATSPGWKIRVVARSAGGIGAGASIVQPQLDPLQFAGVSVLVLGPASSLQQQEFEVSVL